MTSASVLLSPALVMACRALLRIGPLPFHAQQFYQLKQAGCCHLINVSGLEVQQFWPAQLNVLFHIHHYSFSDVFSVPKQHSLLSTPVSAQQYQQQVAAVEQAAFAAAVSQVEQCLQRGESMFLFCQKGRGRSPAVALAALMHSLQLPLPTAAALVQQLHPPAQLSTMSASAGLWYLEHTS